MNNTDRLAIRYLVVLGVLTSLAIQPLPAFGETLRLASWNINNLGAQSGSALRPRAPVRSDHDYIILSSYGKYLDADLIALQEIGSPEAIWRVFPRDGYELFFSSRYEEEVGSHRQNKDIYTAMLVRKGIQVEAQEDIPGLEIQVDFGNGPTWTRRAVALLIQVNGVRLWVVNLHLKSSCHGKSLAPAQSLDCQVLRQQRDALEEWVDQQYAKGIPLVLMGDFNRRFDLHLDRDHFWMELDDHEPTGLDLMRLPFRQPSSCGEHAGDHPIDFFVFDRAAWSMVDRDSFAELVYAPEHLALGHRISDHCPISVTLEIP